MRRYHSYPFHLRAQRSNVGLRQRILVRWPAPALFLLAGWLWVATAVSQAQQPYIDSFVTRSFRGADVLRVDTELEVPSAKSLAVARVTITNPKRNSPSDRNLIVVYYAKDYASAQAFSYTRQVTLKEGTKQSTLDFPHIQLGPQTAWDVAVFESGRELEDKRGLPRNGFSFQWTSQEQSQASFAAVQGTNESSSLVNDNLKILSDSKQLNPAVVTRGMSGAVAQFQGRVVPMHELKKDWRYYFAYSAWILSAPTIAEINATRPDVAKALRHYVAAGGAILIHSASQSREMAEVERLLTADQGQPSSRIWNSEKANKGEWWWQPVRNDETASEADWEALTGRGIAHDAAIVSETLSQSGFGTHLENLSTLAEVFTGEGLGNSEQAPGNSASEDTRGWLKSIEELRQYHRKLLRVLDSEEILRCNYLGGHVLLCATPLTKLSADLPQETMIKLNRVNRIDPASAAMDGNWFWRNLITAVGKPPVWTFCAMITLFGALLGPGLLYFTGRVGRRSLMIFLVPAISFTATGAIILYGVVQEGFDSYARITSVSRIDVPAKVGFAWSRQNYFSGLPPRDGLTFQSDTYVRPVQAEDVRNYYGLTDPRSNLSARVTLVENQNWQGWLKARQQQQLLLGHPLTNPDSPVELRGASGNALRIRNMTEQDLPLVVVRGLQDDYYFCETLAAGQTVEVEAEAKADVESYVAKLMVDYRPLPPPELEDGGSLMQFGSRRRSRSGKGNEDPDVLNIAMRDYFSDRLTMEPYSFATLLSQNDAIEVPLEGRQSDGLHMVIGVQPW